MSIPGTLVDGMHPKFAQRDVGGETYYNNGGIHINWYEPEAKLPHSKCMHLLLSYCRPGYVDGL